MPDSPTPHTEKLLSIVAQLRRQCPWDREQTHQSLLPYLLEEAYETSEAIRDADFRSLKEELGDLLLQVVLHAEIASEAGHFDFEQVAQAIGEKMVRRHPHVFEAEAAGTDSEHSRRWTELKQKERPRRSLLEGTPRSMPALALCQRYGEISASVGFDWGDVPGVWSKVNEELGELRDELQKPERDGAKVAEELGDLLFVLANLARHLGLSAEETGRSAALKFAARFGQMENTLRQPDGRLPQISESAWETAWQEAKRTLDARQSNPQ